MLLESISKIFLKHIVYLSRYLPTGHKTYSEHQMNVVFRSVRRKLLKNAMWT